MKINLDKYQHDHSDYVQMNAFFSEVSALIDCLLAFNQGFR